MGASAYTFFYVEPQPAQQKELEAFTPPQNLHLIMIKKRRVEKNQL
jgi:hypothetical protein|tara:strand:+ start:766 stop:903 length:138 start_codon:yes stop_codon:yes gene_type:complete